MKIRTKLLLLALAPLVLLFAIVMPLTYVKLTSLSAADKAEIIKRLSAVDYGEDGYLFG